MKHWVACELWNANGGAASSTRMFSYTQRTSNCTTQYMYLIVAGRRTRCRRRSGRQCAGWAGQWWPTATTTRRKCPSAWSSHCPCSSESSAHHAKLCPRTLYYNSLMCYWIWRHCYVRVLPAFIMFGDVNFLNRTPVYAANFPLVIKSALTWNHWCEFVHINLLSIIL